MKRRSNKSTKESKRPNATSTSTSLCRKSKSQSSKAAAPIPDYDSDEEIMQLQKLAGFSTSGNIDEEFKQDGLSYLLEILPEYRGDKSLSDLDSDDELPDCIGDDEQYPDFSSEDSFDSEEESDQEDESANEDLTEPEGQNSDDDVYYQIIEPSSLITAVKSQLPSTTSKALISLFNKVGSSNYEAIAVDLAELLKDVDIEIVSADISNFLLNSLVKSNSSFGTCSLIFLVIVELAIKLKSRFVLASVIRRLVQRILFLIDSIDDLNQSNLDVFASVLNIHVKVLSSLAFLNLTSFDFFVDFTLYLLSKASMDKLPQTCLLFEVCHTLTRRIGKLIRTESPHLFLKIVTATHDVMSRVSDALIEATVLLDLVNNLKNGKTDMPSLNLIDSELNSFEKLKIKAQNSGLSETLCSLSFEEFHSNTNFNLLFNSEATITDVSEENKISSIAKQKRLTGTIKKSIFEAIVGSDGIQDAIDRLWAVYPLVNTDKTNQNAGKRLKNVIHDISRVVLVCVLSESNFNPFYVKLSTKLNEINKEFAFGLLLTFWDRIKTISDVKKKNLKNLVLFIVELIKEGVVKSSLFNNLEFSNLNEKQAFFFQVFFICLVAKLNQEQLTSFFSKIVENSVLFSSVVLFLQNFVYPHCQEILKYLKFEHNSNFESNLTLFKTIFS
ncbi:hypothetical protein P9112_002883 [Eukaryota sp. TZLM1-RC]